MPELPEVETVCSELKKLIKHQSFTKIKARRPDLRFPLPIQSFKQLENVNVLSIFRRAKYIIIGFENDLNLLIHLGMSGRLKIIKNKDNYRLEKHDHVIFHLKDHTRICYYDPRRFGSIQAFNNRDLKFSSPLSKIGPEPLDEGFNVSYVKSVFQNKKIPIKSILLNQHIVAGLGNIYICEALYKSSISPYRIAADIKQNEISLLIEAIRDILKKAVEKGGSSLKDYKKMDGELGYFQHEWLVYDKEGEICQKCLLDYGKESLIVREKQSGRSTFYCAMHQV